MENIKKLVKFDVQQNLLKNVLNLCVNEHYIKFADNLYSYNDEVEEENDESSEDEEEPSKMEQPCKMEEVD